MPSQKGKVTRSALARFLTQSNPKGKRRNFPAGETLFVQDRTALGSYVIQRGCVELSLARSDGSRFVVERVEAGGLVGISAGIANRKYGLTARAVSDTDTIYIPRQQVIRLLRTHPEIRMLILASLSRSVQRAIRCLVAGRSGPNKKGYRTNIHVNNSLQASKKRGEQTKTHVI